MIHPNQRVLILELVKKTFESENGNLKYIDEGEGEVIILLRGVTTSG